MNTINAATGISPFQLRLGVSPRVIPPLVESVTAPNVDAAKLIKDIEELTTQAKDSLLSSKISQSLQANNLRSKESPYAVGDYVYLSTSNRWKEYTHAGDGRVAKFMPRFDGPYEITKAFPEKSTYTLNMPNSNVFPTFHASQLKRFVPNDDTLFPSRTLEEPEAVVNDEGEEEWYVDSIADEKRGRRGMEYLVRFRGYVSEHDRWMTRADVEDLEVFDAWLQSKAPTATTTATATVPRLTRKTRK